MVLSMKEKLLMLCYRAPYPLRSGSEIRMYQFIEILSKYYDIDVLYLKEHEEKEDEMAELYRHCCHVEKFSVSVPVRCVQTASAYLFHGLPMQAGYFYSAAMQKWVRGHIAEYKNVLCMHIRTVRYILSLKKELLAGKKLYFDGIDAISLNYRNSYRTARGIRRLINYLEYHRMEKFEKKAYEEIPNSILISQRDKEYIVKDLGAAADPAVVYNYAIDYGYDPSVEKDVCSLVFMGKMNYAPNVDAMLHFADRIYPILKQKNPALEFYIIGGFATEEIKKLGEIDGIHICGFVDNPAEYLLRATMVIAPMISGSGLQNKIVQAMYLGAAVATTVIGADGLCNVTGKEIVIAGDDKELEEKISYYLKEDNADERKQIGLAAREYIKKYYSYEAIRQQMAGVFDFE